MSTSKPSVRASSVAVALLIATATLHAQPDAAGRARLETLGQTPEVAGAAIYQGAVFSQTAGTGKPLFNYERRAGTHVGGLSASHITRDPSGTVIIAEEARFTTAYALQRFDASNLQAGFTGSVEVSKDGTHLEYSLSQNGKLSKAAEDVSDPVVTGPTLHGFVLQHWDALAGGQPIAVRMIVLAEKTSYGFVVRKHAAADGVTAFSITPASALVRMFIAPMKVSFDTASRALLRYEGRVPPMQAEGGKLKSLDARVEYTMQVPVYR
jgi:hypothetical protein